MIEIMFVHASESVRCAVGLRPFADVVPTGAGAAGRGAGARRSLEEGPPQDRGSA